MNEEFKPIPGYEGRYEVSNFGRVKKLDYTQKNPMSNTLCFHKGGMVKGHIDKDGYFTINIKKGKKHYGMRVNRLVAMVFIPNPDNLPVTNHIDNNRQNNHAYNLEWTTPNGNRKHCVKCGRQAQGECVNTNKLSKEDILEIIDLSHTMTQKKLSEKFKVAQSTIGFILTGKTWKSITGGISQKIKGKHYNHGK